MAVATNSMMQVMNIKLKLLVIESKIDPKFFGQDITCNSKILVPNSMDGYNLVSPTKTFIIYLNSSSHYNYQIII